MRDSEELRELREYDAGAPPLDDATRGRVRQRLLAAMTAENGSTRAVRPRRPVLRIAVTCAVAAAVVGGVLVAGQGGSGGGRTAAPPAAVSPVMRNVSAQTVLDGAAAYARRHEQPARPRDDQFVYTKEIVRATDEKSGTTRTYTEENWRSVDGSKPSWVMEAGKGWWSPPLNAGESQWPPQDWKTLRTLPTDPRKLILRLVPGTPPGAEGAACPTGPAPCPTPSDPDVGNGSFDWITDQEWSMVHFQLAGLLKLVPVMPEGLRPAAYQALGMIPGVKVVPGQKDAKGRTGVAITYDDPVLGGGEGSYGGYFLFDPRTYEFLGMRDEATSGSGKHMREYTRFSYLDTWAIVDKAKQRP